MGLKKQETGAPDGKLAGKRIVVRDNICVAGLPMTNGSRVREGFAPELDATVVTRPPVDERACRSA